MCDRETRTRLEKDLAEFDKIILIDGQRADKTSLDIFYESEAFSAACRKLLILSGAEDKRDGNIVWRHSTEDEIRDIIKLYHMYEFSNRISLFSQEDVCGELRNLVNTGVLTQEEAIRAFLY